MTLFILKSVFRLLSLMTLTGVVTFHSLAEAQVVCPTLAPNFTTLSPVAGTNLTTASLPSARYNTVRWVDKNGDFWLFGGSETPGSISNLKKDLWKFDVGTATGTPVWINMTPPNVTYTNWPSLGQLSHGWSDKNGDLWLSEGSSTLWKYSPNTGTGTQFWTRVNSSSFPGATSSNSAITDLTGNFWILNSDGIIFKFTALPSPHWTSINPSGTKPPSRSYPNAWIDKDGDFWLFGGGGRNDLWKCNVGTAVGTPTWTNLTPTNLPTNWPSPQIGATGWTDRNGDFWMFGASSPSQQPNALWKFNSGTSGGIPQWGQIIPSAASTWPRAIPVPGGSHYLATGWLDNSGDLWLFGGPNSSNYKTDGMWKFIVDSSRAVPMWQHISNFWPSARGGAAGWTDQNGDQWLFGGKEYSPSPATYKNDLWKNDSGSTTGTPKWTNRTPDILPSNWPAERTSPVTWTDGKGDFWLFGGVGNSVYNDLWKYSVSTDNPPKWVQVAASDPWPLYSMGSAQARWVDKMGDLWLFSDGLWKYNLATTSGTAVWNQVIPPGNSPSLPITMSWIDPGHDFWLLSGSDAWKYNISTATETPEWTQVFVSGTAPTLYSNKWTDRNGDLWELAQSGPIAELRKCDIFTAVGTPAWTTMTPAGIPYNSDRWPAGRDGATLWSDSSGGLYLFGGGIFSPSKNDYWKFQVDEHRYSVVEDSSVSLQLMFSEVPVENVSIVSGPRNGTATFDPNSSSTLTYTPNPDWFGQDCIVIGFPSEECGWTTETLLINVTRGNDDPPVISNFSYQSAPTRVNETTTFTAIIDNPDQEALTISFNYGDGNTGTSAQYTYIAAGVYTATVIVTDATHTTKSSISVTVDPPCPAFLPLFAQADPITGTDMTDYSRATSMPSARYRAMTWTDKKGDLWLFGGESSGSKGDLWKYNVATTTGTARWSNMTPTPLPNQWPSARSQAATWTDRNGDFFMFGGNGDSALWKYTASTSTAPVWSQVFPQGSSRPNTGGGSTATWTDDNGDLWLLQDSGTGNLWKCNAGTGLGTITWTQTAQWQYGSWPGNLYNSSHWTDENGDLWLFAGNNGREMWKYNAGTAAGAPTWSNLTPATLPSNWPNSGSGASRWVDMRGDFWLFNGGNSRQLWQYNAGSAVGTPYWTNTTPGTLPSNWPGYNQDSATWTDNHGDLWMYSGSGSWNTDLWKYNAGTATETPQWMLIIPPATNWPLARTKSVNWTDRGGNYWLFGGNSDTGARNDFWKYNSISASWTQIHQVGTWPFPQAGGAGWVDKNGDLWMLSGGNLWKYNAGTAPLSPVWTNMKPSPTPSNWPTTRSGAVAWVDGNKDFWLFGGENRNDLWKYNVGTNAESPMWTDMTPGLLPSNWPDVRSDAVGWLDENYNYWLFGGQTAGAGKNDLWKLSLHDSAPEWTNKTPEPLPTNWPSERHSSVVWTDQNSDFWLFSGSNQSVDLWSCTINTAGDPVWILNDVQIPYPQSMKWEWQYGAVGWAGLQGDLWMFGGYGPNNGHKNSLWKLNVLDPSIDQVSKTIFAITEKEKSVEIPLTIRDWSGNANFSVTSPPINGTVEFNSGTSSLTYTPRLNWSGTESLEISLISANCNATATVIITVNPTSSSVENFWLY